MKPQLKSGTRLAVRDDYLAFGRPSFTDIEIEAVARVMRTGWIGQGTETLAFEQELGSVLRVTNVVAVNSCTSALFLSLRALGVGPGDEVVVPSLTWCSTANAALYLGARPVFCDVDPGTLCVTPELVLEKIGPKTRAVILVHMGGLAADVSAIRAAVPDNVALVEDAAHALGATYIDGSPVGSTNNLVCFSFYANKNLSTGEGGAVATNDQALADKIRSLRLHALPADAWRRFTNPKVSFDGRISELGYKMNFTDLQAAIGRVQLSRFAELQHQRFKIAEHYANNLAGTGLGDFQLHLTAACHARHLCLFKLSAERLIQRDLTRDEVLLKLRAANIGVAVHYHPLHKMPLYAQYGAQPLANTDEVAPLLITLPIGACMNISDAAYVCDHLMSVMAQ